MARYRQDEGGNSNEDIVEINLTRIEITNEKNSKDDLPR